MSSQKHEKLNVGSWTCKDEANFINKIGTFREAGITPSLTTVETLLYRYRKALETRVHCSFDKSQALLLINRRLFEIRNQRKAAGQTLELMAGVTA